MMNATLVDSPLPTASADREAELAALVVALHEEVERLRHEVTELRQQVGYWKSMHDRAVRRNEKLQQRVDELEAENRQLKDRLFGSKSEKGSCKDRSNQLEDPEQSSGKPQRRRGHQPDQAGPGRHDEDGGRAGDPAALAAGGAGDRDLQAVVCVAPGASEPVFGVAPPSQMPSPSLSTAMTPPVAGSRSVIA